MARIRRARRKFKRRVARKFKRYMRRGAKAGWRSRRTGRKKLYAATPNKRKIVFNYSTRFEITLPNPSQGLGASGLALGTFQGNSLTDMVTLGGGIAPINGIEQPQEFDQWANFYRLYRVFSASVLLEFIGVLPGDPSLGPYEVLVIPCLGTDNATLSSESFSVTAARPYAKTRIFNYGPDTKVCRLKCFATTKTICYANGNDVSENNSYSGAFPIINPPPTPSPPPSNGASS